MRKAVLLTLLIAWSTATAHAQIPVSTAPDAGPEFPFGRSTRRPASSAAAPKHLGPFGERDWRADIDAYWGPGLPTSEKLGIFDAFWKKIDRRFACFPDLDVHWRALRRKYRVEIAAGVSAGRFAAIMNHLSRALRESHTAVFDVEINGRTPLEPGTPLLVVGGWGDNSHFGAGLTPLPNGSLLVYSVVPDHPLGLEVGDIVLGYDGVAWKDIYPRLIEAELPVTGFWWGSSPSSYEHSWLMAAGLNWHLFDTIDVVKHRTGETVHLSTKPLVGAEMQLFCSEQLPVPGVPFPKDVEANLVGYGVVEGTRIGYIYVWGWYGNVRQDFRAAVEALAADTTGLIIDFRMDYGGNMFLSNDGLSLLFPAPTPTIGWVVRKNKRNHLAMEADPDGPPSNYVIPSNGVGYDHPIAVLVGPGALSSGDQVALRMRFHPRARLFGESTSTAFNAPTRLSLHPEWGAAYAAADSYLLSAPDNLLTHDELEVDEPVWLTQDDVIAGRDSVVSAAIDWINRSNAP
jgi:hypothetical protein